MKFVPVEKQSKRAQREYYSRQRRDWNGINPTTRVFEKRKPSDRRKTEHKFDLFN